MPDKSSSAVSSVFAGATFENVGPNIASLLLTGNPHTALQVLIAEKLVDREIKFDPGEIGLLQKAAIGSKNIEEMATKFRRL